MFTDGFQKGHPYGELPPCIHVGILSFNQMISPNYYHKINLMDEKTKEIYSRKFQFHMIELKKLENIKEKQKRKPLYQWAKLIAAQTWEELEHESKGNKYMERALEEMIKISQDENLDIGPGRTGRALMNYYLISNGHPPIIIHVEDQQCYYDALHKFYTKSDLSSLIEFLKNQTIKTWKSSVKRHEISQQYELGEINNASHPVRKYGLKSILENLENGSKLTNKYKMSLQDNIFFANRNLVDSIWKEAVIEGIDISFPATKEIFEGRTVTGLSVKDTIAISNLKLAWQFILCNIEKTVDLAYIQQVNLAIGATIVNDCGQLRRFPVSIGGTNWRPELPDPDKAAATIKEIIAQAPGEERALHMFSYLCRAQLFYDGNKRTAQLVANKMLIADGAGILAIPTDRKQDFGILLVDFYETGDDTKLLAFLDETSIGGIFPNPERERQMANTV